MRKSRVLNVTTGVVYNSLKEAAQDTGASVKGISNVINGYCKTAGGFEWRYADESF